MSMCAVSREIMYHRYMYHWTVYYQYVSLVTLSDNMRQYL